MHPRRALLSARLDIGASRAGLYPSGKTLPTCLWNPCFSVEYLGELGHALGDQRFRGQGIAQTQIVTCRVRVSGPFWSGIKGDTLLERWRCQLHRVHSLRELDPEKHAATRRLK